MPNSDRTDRPNRLVMFLGIATIVLFSVNLMSVLANRVWPKLQHMIATSETAAPETPVNGYVHSSVFVGRMPLGHMTFRFENRSMFKKKKCMSRHALETRDRMDAAIDRLENDIERESDWLEVELQNAEDAQDRAHAEFEEATALKLHLIDDNSMVKERSF